jgi:dTDP-glucose 4,6-dehydratase
MVCKCGRSGVYASEVFCYSIGGSMKLLITGGCGFVGHHFVEHFLKQTDWDIITFDKLTYAASGLDRVRDINAFDDKRVHFYAVDFTREISEGVIQECGDVDYILHMGAETHVDNSISDPKPFVYSNVVGTFNMLEFARKCPNLKAFVYFSTDEVFGPAPEGVDYKEWDRYNSTNPYSATKAGGEELVLAYMNTYKLPGYITHCMNIFGERQHPEKFIPICIRKIDKGETVTIHGTPDKQKAGSRFYIHARNVANASHFLLDNFEQREKYNIVGEKELSNLELAQRIADAMGKELKYEIVDFHSSRPGHDLRYSLNGEKMRSIGWETPMTIDETIKSVVEWTLKNRKWLGE